MASGIKRLADSIVGMTPDTVSELTYGIVTNLDPLTIKREGPNGRIPITAEFLVLSKHCKPFTIKSSAHLHIAPEGATDTRLQELLIWDGLKMDERVILMSFNKGQSFFVEKLEEWGTEA